MVTGFKKNGKFRPTGFNPMVNGKFVVESNSNQSSNCSKCGTKFLDPPSKKNGTSNICYSCSRKL